MSRISLPLAILLLALSAATVTAAAAQGPPRLIVRADDMGYSHAGNEAILKSYAEGVASSVEVIVPSPWFPEAARMLAEHPEVDVGVHLAITSEWDNVKWRPLTESPSLTDPDGYFFPMIRANPNYPGRAVLENPWTLEDVEREFRAQIETALRHIPRISHVSGHMGSTGFDPRVQEMTRRLTREYGIDIETSDHGVLPARYAGERETSAQKIESFLRMLEGLEAGKTYLFVDHPGLDTPELRAIHHIGYEDVALDRQGVTDAWTHPRVKALISERGIQLIGYRDLKR
jgi:chitin disaccharide deacetylase